LIIGGHEFSPPISTQILWGSSVTKFNSSNRTIIPAVDNYGVITDLDIADLDGDGNDEIAITRTGGKLINNQPNYFYNGWFIQIVKLNNKVATDISSNFIELNSKDYSSNNEWITWMRFEDYDNNGKIDFFSTNFGAQSFVRWELQNKKLVRIN